MSYLNINAINAPASAYAKLANIVAKRDAEFAATLVTKGIKGNVTARNLGQIAPDYFTSSGLTPEGKATIKEIQKEMGLSANATIKQLVKSLKDWKLDLVDLF